MLALALHVATLVSPGADVDTIRGHLLHVAASLEANPPPLLSAAARARREALLGALVDYAEAGRFPHNHRHASSVPVFIDEHGTACAVGMLMIASGRADLARAVADADVLIRVADIGDPAVLAWADDNGFALDELAWIQPSYAESYVEGYDGADDGALWTGQVRIGVKNQFARSACDAAGGLELAHWYDIHSAAIEATVRGEGAVTTMNGRRGPPIEVASELVFRSLMLRCAIAAARVDNIAFLLAHGAPAGMPFPSRITGGTDADGAGHVVAMRREALRDAAPEGLMRYATGDGDERAAIQQALLAAPLRAPLWEAGLSGAPLPARAAAYWELSSTPARGFAILVALGLLALVVVAAARAVRRRYGPSFE